LVAFAWIVFSYNPSALQFCERCRLFVAREEKQRIFLNKYTNSLRKHDAFLKTYQDLSAHKQELQRMTMQYEYLTTSLESDLGSSNKKGNYSAVFEVSTSVEVFDGSVVKHHRS
jgi:hypothetical protein